MPKLVPIAPKKLMRLLHHYGFVLVRIRGSHHFIKNLITQKVTTIPIHGNKEIGKSLLKSILKDIQISVEEYEKLRLDN